MTVFLEIPKPILRSLNLVILGACPVSPPPKPARVTIPIYLKRYTWKYPLFLTDFNEISIYRQIFEKVQISDFMKIRPMAADLFHAGRQFRVNTLPKYLTLS